ncbi:hypothetical protein GRI97_00325 [Altererythrobacter xixiisoli]|uniref:Uncharacterized protein n=1 Tax=Croceibacterium xixiisoli TaxID=1476466 RepID=A0A6I4TQR1_9SPHN|nr:DUF6489 family protein [Croceibacterium xixiisoli]MXO97431.1 hypothetical protein [Croceibacterium xixiisoli]
MKVHVEIDCSPEEARRFMGLPDVEKANAAYVEAVTQAMSGGMAGGGANSLDQLEAYAKQLAPMGQMGLKMFQNLMDSAARQATAFDPSNTTDKDKPKG